MAGTNKIFKDLQDHAVTPPPGLYAKLWKKIKQLADGNRDLLQSVLPETTAAETIAIPDEKIWSSLRDYVDIKNTAPAFDFKKITDTLTSSEEKPVVIQKTKVIYWTYRAAAAAAITGIIFLIYTNTAKPGQDETVLSNTKKNELIGTTKTEKGTTAVSTKKDTNTVKNNHKTGAVQQSNNDQVTGNNSITKHVRANILNNDFLYTLTSFNYSQANYFFADVKKDPKISMNNYSYVNISDKMAALLKQQYAVNHRKKPTWKARRAKEKLNKWKRKDEKNFDTKPVKNPLDILDLSEFIFKN